MGLEAPALDVVAVTVAAGFVGFAVPDAEEDVVEVVVEVEVVPVAVAVGLVVTVAVGLPVLVEVLVVEDVPTTAGVDKDEDEVVETEPELDDVVEVVVVAELEVAVAVLLEVVVAALLEVVVAVLLEPPVDEAVVGPPTTVPVAVGESPVYAKTGRILAGLTGSEYMVALCPAG